MARLEYEGLELYCTESELLAVVLDDGSKQLKCPFTKGEQFLQTFNIPDFLSVVNCQLLMIFLTSLGYIGAYLALRRLVVKKTAKE